MKSALIILLLLIQSGCSSSSDDNVNPLVSTWLSNCYERTDGNGAFIAYAIKNLVITDAASVSNTSEFTDINCTIPNGTTFTLNQNYTLGEQVATTDGATAQRITLTSDFDFLGQPIKMTIENIYRITGVELNFGDYISGETPSLDYAVTFIKQ